MRAVTVYLIFGLVIALPVLVPNPQFGNPVIVSPRPGDALQGIVGITGSSNVTGFISVEISFAFEGNNTGTWYLIAVNNQPVLNQTLATWDTTVITDGEYDLRLRVYLSDGSFEDTVISGLRVRNFSPAESLTPTVPAPEATLLSTIMATAIPFPTPTNLPRNPAVLDPTDVSTSILLGGLAAILTFVSVGIYLWLRRK